MPIKIIINGTKKLRETGLKLREAKKKFQREILNMSNRFGLKSVRTSKKDYLSGPRPEKLGVVSGRLRSSIRHRVEQSGNKTTISIGTDVPYARIHELGGILTRKKKNGSSFSVKIRKRSFLEPAVKKSLPELKRELTEFFGRGFFNG